ncbi:MAG: sulfatase-like hydrolase/transferase, partial [Actinobacteria bacterium]|nr:sulfatase-like hydrolase/transferase [Actinomycetota bacterium]
MLTYDEREPFPGTVGRELADSVQAYPEVVKPSAGTPNVLLVVLDDVGYAQIGCFGSDVETPTFDRLAANGLRYRSFHTTAMCSPTRACLLTGRNQHTTGMGGISDNATGFPGFDGRIDKATGFLSEVLRDEGFATMAIGKWHLAPREESDLAASRKRWPLGRGFERYYGFLGAETNQYAPDL